MTVDSVLFPSLHIHGDDMKTNAQIAKELKMLKKKKIKRKMVGKYQKKLNVAKQTYKDAVDNFFIKLENI